MQQEGAVRLASRMTEVPFGIDVRVGERAMGSGGDEIHRDGAQTSIVQESLQTLQQVIHNTLNKQQAAILTSLLGARSGSPLSEVPLYCHPN